MNGRIRIHGKTWLLTGLLAVIVAIGIALSLLQSNEMPRLVGGYRLSMSNSSTVVVLAPQHFRSHESNPVIGLAVAARVTRVAVEGSVIIGFVESSPDSELVRYETPGYFIIDTTSGNVSSGLAEAEMYDLRAKYLERTPSAKDLPEVQFRDVYK